MCLAIPMQVVAIRGGSDELFDPQVAMVESDGVRKEIRLEMADRIPAVGEYVIIHAGFAIRVLDRGRSRIQPQPDAPKWPKSWSGKGVSPKLRNEMRRRFPQPRDHRAPGGRDRPQPHPTGADHGSVRHPHHVDLPQRHPLVCCPPA